jgi:protein-tyrosine phosphatase
MNVTPPGITHRRNVYAGIHDIGEKLRVLYESGDRRGLVFGNDAQWMWDLLFELDACLHRIPFNIIRDHVENGDLRNFYIKPLVATLMMAHFLIVTQRSTYHLAQRHVANYAVVLLPLSYSARGPLPEILRRFLELPEWSNTLLLILSRWTLAGLVVTYLSRFYPNILGLPGTFTGKGVSKKHPNLFAWPYNLLFSPFLRMEEFIWRNFRTTQLIRKLQDPWNLIWSGEMGKLYLGESLVHASQLPPKIDIVFDLTNEVEENPTIVSSCNEYLCEPVWDQGLPTDIESYISKIKHVAERRGDHFIHCFMGRGRSVLAMIHILVARGIAPTVEDAQKIIYAGRPCVGLHLSSDKMHFLKSLEPRFAKNHSPWRI